MTIADMPHLLASAAHTDTSRSGGRRWSALVPIAASLLLALAALFFLAPSHWFSDNTYATTTAQIKDIRLDDGSLLTLGAASSVVVDFTKTQRHVTLKSGEAFFEVTRDTSRPFFVYAGDTTVRVLGTKFDVHYGPRAVRVAVLEGRVAISKTQAQPSILTPGEATVATKAGGIGPIQRVTEENLGAWRTGRLVYIDARLRDVIADIERYYDGEIVLADQALGDLQLTTAFRTDQIDRMLEVLAATLPIEARHEGRRILLSSKSR